MSTILVTALVGLGWTIMLKFGVGDINAKRLVYIYCTFPEIPAKCISYYLGTTMSYITY